MAQSRMDAAVIDGIVGTTRALLAGEEITLQVYVDTNGLTWEILTFFNVRSSDLHLVEWHCHSQGQTRALSRGVLQEAEIESVMDALDVARLAIEAVAL